MRSQLRAIGGRPAVCRAVFKFQGELLQGQCLHAQAHGPRQRRGEIPPQPTSADKPMSNGTWRQDQLPAAALAARRPIRIEGSASAQAVKAQWLCTCYTWPGSNWRPSACGADVIATRPQVRRFCISAERIWQTSSLSPLSKGRGLRCGLPAECRHPWSSGYDVSPTR